MNASTKARKEGSVFHSKKISQGSNLIEKERKSKTANNAVDRHNPYNPKREKNNVILDIRTGIKKSKEQRSNEGTMSESLGAHTYIVNSPKYNSISKHQEQTEQPHKKQGKKKKADI